MADSTKLQEEDKTKKITPTSIISISRETSLGLDIADPLNLDQLYASVPEVSRVIDFRGGMICPNGYEIFPTSEEADAKEFAALCYQIVQKSGGVGFFEQFHKNTDLYGDGYTELVSNELNEIVELAHVHPYHFGYETTIVDDPNNPGTQIPIIKVDKNSQKPVGFALFKVDPASGDLVVDKKIPLETIAHLKFKTVGDNFYGISIIQPMIGSITRKIKLEDYADRSARLIAVPKLVLKGNYDNDVEKREDAREAANLDVNDVIVLQGEDTSVEFVKPGTTNIPQLREMFITNITTASGVPRPALTSESAEINKATMDELMKNTRGTLKSHQLLISNLFEHVIFPRIALSHGIQNYESIIPKLYFLEDNDTAAANVATIQKKATALTSLANTYTLLLNSFNTATTTSTAPTEDVNKTSPADVEEELIKKDSENGIASNKAKEMSMELAEDKVTGETEDTGNERIDKLGLILTEMEDLLLTTIQQFKFNNDTRPQSVEPYKQIKSDSTKRAVENSAFIPKPKTNNALELSFLNTYYTRFSLEANSDDKKKLYNNYKTAVTAYKKGYTVIDNKTEKIIELQDFLDFEEKYFKNDTKR